MKRKLTDVFRAWLSAKKESETAYNGFLSTKGEKHAIGIGIGVGATVSLVGGKDASWLLLGLANVAIGAREVSVGQLKDVQKEPAYAFFGAMIGFLVMEFIVKPRMGGGVL